MQFEVARAVLIERQQQDLYLDSAEEDLSREQWLRHIFSLSMRFEHRNRLFHYAPIPELSKEMLIAGRIGRQITTKENEPPESHLKETERSAWIASLVFIDPSHHKDGQKIAIQEDKKVGVPVSILRSLAEQINGQTPSHKFVMEINAISDAEDFWRFVRENKGEITSVEFELIPPNMFGLRDDFDRELKELRDNEKAQKVNFEIKSADGLTLDTSRIRKTVEYTVEGGGSVRARTKSRKTFNSRLSTKRINVPEDKEVSPGSESFARKVMNWIFTL